MADAPPPPSRLTQAQRREESTLRLHRAFADLVCEQGYTRTTAAEIGERAGYSRNMVRDRFGSKQNLFYDVVFAAFTTPEPRRSAEEGTGLQRVLHMVDSVRKRAERSPEAVRATSIVTFEAVASNDPLARVVLAGIADYLDRRTRHIADGIADGSIRADVDPRAEAEILQAEEMGVAFDDLMGLSGRPLPELLAIWRAEVEARLSAEVRR
ncbi:MAG TPA: TetR/AcrR family transcriptional regulator [Aquihabitans sp.]|nr:TetR/AcrR family transcriptional regulator [Aquihabitans sp.]